MKKTDYPQKEIEKLKTQLGKSTWTMLHSFAAGIFDSKFFFLKSNLLKHIL